MLVALGFPLSGFQFGDCLHIVVTSFGQAAVSWSRTWLVTWRYGGVAGAGGETHACGADGAAAKLAPFLHPSLLLSTTQPEKTVFVPGHGIHLMSSEDSPLCLVTYAAVKIAGVLVYQPKFVLYGRSKYTEIIRM